MGGGTRIYVHTIVGFHRAYLATPNGFNSPIFGNANFSVASPHVPLPWCKPITCRTSHGTYHPIQYSSNKQHPHTKVAHTWKGSDETTTNSNSDKKSDYDIRTSGQGPYLKIPPDTGRLDEMLETTKSQGESTGPAKRSKVVDAGSPLLLQWESICYFT